MKSYILCVFVAICFQAVSAGNETEQHKLLSICEWFYNNEGKRDEEKSCSDCIKDIYKENAEPTDEELNKCEAVQPQRFQTCTDCNTKLGRFLELHKYRQEVGEIYRKYYTQILTEQEQIRLHQVFGLVFIVHKMNKDLPKLEMELLGKPVYQCFNPGTSANSEEENAVFNPATAEQLMQEFASFANNTESKDKKRDVSDDAAQHRTLIKNIYKKVYNLYVCGVNAVMSDTDAAQIMKDYLKTFEGVIPIMLAKYVYKCPNHVEANQA